MKSKQNNILSISVISIFFILAWLIHYYTPIHSDDYRYFSQGISFEAKFNQYMSWSGRVIADSISSGILLIKNRFIISFIQALGHLALIYFIVKIAYGRKRFSPLVFTLIFVLYWIANPNLGQTTFWVVGSANYMWTNLVICIFLYFFMNFILTEKVKKWQFIGIGILAFLAGWTNENTSATLFLITLFYGIWEFVKHKKKLALFFSLLVLIGALFLILAPGNFARLQHPCHTTWKSYTLIQKGAQELFVKIPKAFTNFWQIYLVSIFILWFGRNKNTHSMVFFTASILSILAFTLSPSFPYRSINGTLVFLLIFCAFTIKTFIEEKRTHTYYTLGITALLGVLYFAPSYFLIYRAYNRLTNQAEIRDNLVLKAKQNNLSKIYIPQFFNERLVKKGDMIDLYFNPWSMAEYFDYHGRIKLYNIDYEYSLMSKITYKNSLYHNEYLTIIKHKNSLIYRYKGKFNPDYRLFLTLHYKNGGIENLNDFPAYLLSENGYDYFVSENIDMDKIKIIATGIVNKTKNSKKLDLKISLD